MDQFYLILLGIGLLSTLLIATLVYLIWFSGIFASVVVDAGQPPVSNLQVAYKFGKGPYKNSGEIFTETFFIAPDLRTFGVYYDDPKKVPEHKLRWAVGSILAEGTEIPDPEISSHFQDKGYKFFTFPAVANVVKTSFPFRTQLSIIIGIYRVYPMLAEYIREKKLCAHPWMEIYGNQLIHYMAPLSRQEHFYVAETSSAGSLDLVWDEEPASGSDTGGEKVDEAKEEVDYGLKIPVDPQRQADVWKEIDSDFASLITNRKQTKSERRVSNTKGKLERTTQRNPNDGSGDVTNEAETDKIENIVQEDKERRPESADDLQEKEEGVSVKEKKAPRTDNGSETRTLEVPCHVVGEGGDVPDAAMASGLQQNSNRAAMASGVHQNSSPVVDNNNDAGASSGAEVSDGDMDGNTLSYSDISPDHSYCKPAHSPPDYSDSYDTSFDSVSPVEESFTDQSGCSPVSGAAGDSLNQTNLSDTASRSHLADLSCDSEGSDVEAGTKLTVATDKAPQNEL